MPTGSLIAVVLTGALFGCQPPIKSDSKDVTATSTVAGTKTQVDTVPATTTDTTLTATDSSTSTDTTTVTDSSTETTSDTSTDTVVDTARKLSLSGVVQLGVGSEDDVVINKPILGASVFLKGFPDTVVLTNSVGAFQLALDLPAGDSLTGSDDYEVVMWYTTPNTQHKFGTLKPTTILPNVETDLGTVKLGFTTQIRFHPKDGLTDIDHTLCTVTFPGYEGKVTIAPAANASADLKADYLPPGAYSYHIACNGYHPRDVPLTIDPPTSSGNWVPEDVALVAVTP